MLNTLNANIFNSINFLAEEMDKIDKYNNLLSNRRERKFITSKCNIFESIDYITNSEDYNIQNSSFPFIRKTTVNLSKDAKEEDFPDFNLYFIKGFRIKDFDKYYENFGTSNANINTLLYLQCDSLSCKNSSILFFEDNISQFFNSVVSLSRNDYDNNLNIYKDTMMRIITQNKVIANIIDFYYLIFKNIPFIQNAISDNMKFFCKCITTYLKIKEPYILNTIFEHYNQDISCLFAFAALRKYFIAKFNLNIDLDENKEIIHQTMIDVISTYYFNFMLELKLKSPDFDNIYSKIYNKEEIDTLFIIFESIVNLIEYWDNIEPEYDTYEIYSDQFNWLKIIVNLHNNKK